MLRSAMMAAALGMSTPALAEPAPAPVPDPVKVGIIDVHVKRLVKRDDNTKIHYREFVRSGEKSGRWDKGFGYDHGELVASAVVEQIRSVDPDVPIEIYAANPMVMMKPNGFSEAKGLIFRSEGAQEALGWFAENNVKVVIATFNGKDTPGMRAFMAEAEKLGMIVFASAGNAVVKEPVYPAAYPEAVAVAADNSELAFRKVADVAKRVHFTMEGTVRAKSSDYDVGSSYAVARAAALGAYAIRSGLAVDRESTIAVLREVAEEKPYDVQGMSITASYLDRVKSAEALASRSDSWDLMTLAAYQARGGAGR